MAKAKDKVKIIKIGEILAALPEASQIDKQCEAIKQVYNSEKVIASYEVKGERIFICEV